MVSDFQSGDLVPACRVAVADLVRACRTVRDHRAVGNMGLELVVRTDSMAADPADEVVRMLDGHRRQVDSHIVLVAADGRSEAAGAETLKILGVLRSHDVL